MKNLQNLLFAFSIMVLAVFLIGCTQTETTTSEETTTVGETPQEQPQAEDNTTVEENVTAAQNVSVAAGPTCVDGDNGLNTQFPSDVVDITGQKFYDKCDGPETLFERKCGKDGKVVTSKVGCLYGCKDGACIPPPQEGSTSESSSSSSSSSEAQGNYTGSTTHCTDTDGGETYDLQGTCGDASTKNLKDSCIGSDTLIEWACHRTQDKCVQIQHGCNCAAGACQ